MDFTFIKTHKIVYFCICILALLFLSACAVDVHAGERPPDYPDSKWVCEDPNIVFVVNQSHEVACEINGEPLRSGWLLLFGYGTDFWIHDNNAGITLFRGNSEYYPDKMYVDVVSDDLFDGAYVGKRIVFYRIE